MTGALISFGGLGDDESDASAVRRKLEARKTAKVEQRLWSQSLGWGHAALLGEDWRWRKAKIE